MDMHDIAEIVSGKEGSSVRLRQATVTGVADDGTLSVTIGGGEAVVTGVKAFASLAPVVGESVWLVTDGVDLIAIGAVGAASSGGMPSGAIIMWSGSIAAIPAGWHLCDGTNGTPDLRNRFVVGAGSDYAPGATGGEASHLLTAAEAGVGAHTHPTAPGGSVKFQTTYNGVNQDMNQLASGGGVYTTFYSTTGATSADASSAHNNLPPYFALAYIMKV